MSLAADGLSSLNPASCTLSSVPEVALPAPAVMIERLNEQLPSLPERKLRDLWFALHDTREGHTVDLRVSVWLPVLNRLYFNVAVGRENGNGTRSREEGGGGTTRAARLYTFVAMAALGCSLFGLFCLLYLLKSILKINVFSGDSPFHPLYALLIS
jgi:hypothetical protein